MNPISNILEQCILFIYNVVGNYGIAIIGITILIKLVLLPLTIKQDKSMRGMKLLQPELEKIKAKYKDQPQIMNEKTMALYKEHKVNPAGGCLPIFLQLPILWALFGVLRKNSSKWRNNTFRFNILMDVSNKSGSTVHLTCS